MISALDLLEGIMANAMLDENFKSSHPDLVACDNENENRGRSAISNDAATSQSTSKSSSPGRKKSVDFSLDPQPKRAKASDPWTPKQIVDGKSVSLCTCELNPVRQTSRC